MFLSKTSSDDHLYLSYIGRGELLIYRIESYDMTFFTSFLVNHPGDRYYQYLKKVHLEMTEGSWVANIHDKRVVRELIYSIEH